MRLREIKRKEDEARRAEENRIKYIFNVNNIFNSVER